MASYISDNSLWDIINHPSFRKKVEAEILAYKMRPLPKPGFRYRRTPADTLIDMGIFDFIHVKNIFIDIFSKNQTPYSSSVRGYISNLCMGCVFAVMRENNMIKMEEDGKEEDGNESPNKE